VNARLVGKDNINNNAKTKDLKHRTLIENEIIGIYQMQDASHVSRKPNNLELIRCRRHNMFIGYAMVEKEYDPGRGRI